MISIGSEIDGYIVLAGWLAFMKKMFALRAINALAGWLDGLYGFFRASRD